MPKLEFPNLQLVTEDNGEHPQAALNLKKIFGLMVKWKKLHKFKANHIKKTIILIKINSPLEYFENLEF